MLLLKRPADAVEKPLKVKLINQLRAGKVCVGAAWMLCAGSGRGVDETSFP
jgi:hypothetical protein